MRGTALLTLALVAGALAAAPTPARAAAGGCGSAAPPAGPPSAEVRQSVAAYKAAHDTLHLSPRRVAPVTRTCAEATAAASGAVVLAKLNQQGQVSSYFCGPATVSEMATTRGVPVDQRTAAGYMGTDPNSGTSVSRLTSGLNHFVGDPGGGSYAFVWLSYDPTDSERAVFAGHLRSDLTTYGGWPVAGDAWEVPGGPHLAGHPNVEIFHWIELGGLSAGDASVYYADSATTVWSGVPAYSWIDTGTLVTILGGRGYAW